MGKEGRNFIRFEDAFDIPEDLSPKLPNLFQDVGVVYAATHNENKLDAVTKWVNSHNIVRGAEGLKTIAKVVNGDEPDWTDALRVALDKTESVVNDLKNNPGPEALVIGSDVVVWINGEPKHNLSRDDDLSGNRLAEEILQLQQIFSKPSVIMWDVAIGIRRKRNNLKAVTGDRIVVAYDQISPDLIAEIFWKDIKGALGRNTRLPLIDDSRLTQHIIGAEKIPLREIASHGGILKDWHDLFGISDPESYRESPVSKEILAQFQEEIIGGFPVNGRLKKLESVKASCYKDIIIV